MTFAEIINDIPAERLPSVIDLWLWEFEAPTSWPSAVDVAVAIDALRGRPDGEDCRIQAAISKCLDYLG